MTDAPAAAPPDDLLQLENQVCFALAVASRSVIGVYRPLLEPLGLTHPQFVLLACTWWLSRSGETPNQARVAARAGVEVKTASEVFARLEAKGLITRATDAEDSRAKAVRATPDGEALARRAVALVEDADARFFEGLDTGDVVSLLRRLGRTP